MAIAAMPAQHKITDQRDVVVPTNRVIAARAMRAGKDNRFPTGQARNADIQKASKTEAKQPNNDVSHCHVIPLQVPEEIEIRNSKIETRKLYIDFRVSIFELRLPH